MKFQKQGFGDATVGKVIFTVAFSQGRQATLQQKEKRTSIQEMMKDREAWHAAIHGVAESDYNSATKQQQLCSSVQSLSRVQLFATSWTAALQASLSIINSRSLLKLISIDSVMLSDQSFSAVPFSSCLQSFPASRSFQMSQFFASGGQSIGASASVLPMNIQD